MLKFSGALWIELVVGLAVSTAAALALWGAGLSEVVWAPFFAVAVASSSGRRRWWVHRQTGG